MAKRFGVFLLGAALISMLIPKKAKKIPAGPQRDARKQPYRPLFALVQTSPQALVLAVSDSRADLEAEMAELNATWNCENLRIKSQTYEIQPVCLLQTARDPFPKLTDA